MLENLLDIVPNEDGNFYFDNYGEPFIYALIGFVVVFVGICILILIIYLVGLLMKKTHNLAFITEHKQRSQQKKAAKALKEQLEKEDVVREVKYAKGFEPDGHGADADGAGGAEGAALADAEDEVSPEVCAAIMAAIMAYYEQEKPKCEFVVRRIKRL